MANSVDVKLGSVDALSPALVAKITGMGASELVEIPCGFMPARVSIILDGTVDMLLEHVDGMSGYFKLATAVSGIEAGALVVASSGGFSVDSSLEGAGNYYVTAWR